MFLKNVKNPSVLYRTPVNLFLFLECRNGCIISRSYALFRMWRSQVISFLKISFYTIWSHWNPVWQGLGKSLWSGQGWISRITLVLLLEDSPESCPLAKWPHRDTEGVDEDGTGDECALDRTLSCHCTRETVLYCCADGAIPWAPPQEWAF